MNEKFTPTNMEDEKFNMTNEDSDYKNLIIRLKYMSSIIASLKKKYLDKF